MASRLLQVAKSWVSTWFGRENWSHSPSKTEVHDQTCQQIQTSFRQQFLCKHLFWLSDWLKRCLNLPRVSTDLPKSSIVWCQARLVIWFIASAAFWPSSSSFNINVISLCRLFHFSIPELQEAVSSSQSSPTLTTWTTFSDLTTLLSAALSLSSEQALTCLWQCTETSGTVD
jgi:hypothetical protein